MSSATLPASTRLHVPFHDLVLEEAAIARAVAVLRSGWLTTGPECRAFEQELAARIGGGVQAVAVSSGTAALHLGLEAAGVRAGDLVVVPAYTFTATAEVARYLGAEVLLADVDPITGAMTPATVSAAVAELPSEGRDRVRALMPVHFAGRPCDLDGLRALAGEHGWALVDDAAHALPAAHQGATIGTGTDATAFSFYVTKPLATGEGGMLVTAREDIADRARIMRLHGIDRDAFERYRQRDAWEYEIVDAGFKYNLSDLAAAIGRGQLPRLDAHRRRRARIAAAYTDALAGVDGLACPPPAAPGDEHAWHLYALRVCDGRAVRDAMVRELGALGVGASVHFIPLHHQPYYRDRYRLRPEDLPGASRLFSQECSLPIYPAMSDEQVAAVVRAVPEALRRARALTAAGPS